MILDDGGDATLLVHKGVEFEAPAPCRRPADYDEYRIILADAPAHARGRGPQRFTSVARTSRA